MLIIYLDATNIVSFEELNSKQVDTIFEGTLGRDILVSPESPIFRETRLHVSLRRPLSRKTILRISGTSGVDVTQIFHN